MRYDEIPFLISRVLFHSKPPKTDSVKRALSETAKQSLLEQGLQSETTAAAEATGVPLDVSNPALSAEMHQPEPTNDIPATHLNTTEQDTGPTARRSANETDQIELAPPSLNWSVEDCLPAE
eukprot:m.43356 g.43356  ORF g.43356 m.43356 type:complete len:122 (+) comp46722_c0_seq1:583-948(+)